jgi:hypothetical protein
MAQVTYRQEAFAPREFGATYLRRMIGALRFQLRDLALDLDLARRELRIAHDLHDLDLRSLRDIGVERDAC